MNCNRNTIFLLKTSSSPLKTSFLVPHCRIQRPTSIMYPDHREHTHPFFHRSVSHTWSSGSAGCSIFTHPSGFETASRYCCSDVRIRESVNETAAV